MKRLVVETDTQVLIEYHANEQACINRLPTLKRLYTVIRYAIKDVVRHVELKPLTQVETTAKPYAEIK